MPEMAQGQQFLVDGPNPREDELRTAGCAILADELSLSPEKAHRNVQIYKPNSRKIHEHSICLFHNSSI